MKKLLSTVIVIALLHHQIFAQCNSGSYTVAGNTVITGSCKITGDLTILSGTTLNVDLTGAAADTFVVRGNVLLQGNAVLWIHSTAGSTNDQFIISNNFNGQRIITTRGSSKIQLEHIEFRTQEGNLSGASSISMNYNAEDSSIFYVNKSWLNNQTAWLLFNLKNKSTLIGYEPKRVPTEIYLQDAAQISLHGVNTKTGIWLNFESITDTLDLPPNQSQPLTWKIGRSVGGLNTAWYLEVDSVLQQEAGFGVQIFPSSKMTINGTGLPVTGELKVAMMFANNSETVKDLKVGLQNTTVTNGPNGSVTLNNVNLGPIAWQLYALMNENLFIKNSIVNEIGIGGPSNVTVDCSVLQLAVLAAVGVGGSTLTINNSEIWNQEITAANNSKVVLNNCKVTGSAFSTTDALSRITVNGGCFLKNPSGCTQAAMVDINTGQPYCNPFIPPGFPQNLTPATVTFIDVNYNCVTGINGTGSTDSFQIFPNPAAKILNIYISGTQNPKGQIQIFNSIGMLLKEIDVAQTTQINIVDLPSGLYFVHLKNKESKMQKFIKQ